MRLAILALVGVLALAACTSSEDASTAPVEPSTTSVTSTVPIPDVTTTARDRVDVTAPSTIAIIDGQIDWVLSLLNGTETSEADAADRFSETFREYVAPGQFLELVRSLRSTVATTWVDGQRRFSSPGALVEMSAGGMPWTMTIAIDAFGDIETLLLAPVPEDIGDPPATFDELVDRMRERGDVSLLVADVTSGSCVPVIGVDDGLVRPVASSFKLWVLGALVDAIASGGVSWDDRIAIRNELKTLPTGTFQSRPEGSEASVLEFAEAMIARSDNTATDHLIDLVGRDAVERALVDYGNSASDRNIPMLATREFFALKLGVPEEVAAEWIAADIEERRRMLDDLAQVEVGLAAAEGWDTPSLIDEVEWFATAHDLCRALTGLAGTATTPDGAPVRSILALNPGVPYDPDDWSYVGFKGGSETGVLSLAWYLEGDNGDFVYVVNVTNPDRALPDDELALLAASGFDLITDLVVE